MSILTDPDVWANGTDVTPPPQWQQIEADGRFWWHTDSSSTDMVHYIGTDTLPLSLKFVWEIVEAPDGPGGVYLKYDLGAGTQVQLLTSDYTDTSGEYTLAIPAGTTTLRWSITTQGSLSLYSGTIAVGGAAGDFNCDCEEVSPYKTLAELRTDMLIGMGYAAQASNPPPGMADLVKFLLNRAQDFLWLRYKEVRGERFFSWVMEPNQRYYGIADGDDACPGFTLDPKKITWVGFEDLNKTWVRLTEGIPPEFYTRAQTTPGWPSHYEIRSCIEIFPAPQAAYTLWVKGNFGLGPLSADTDRTTIDDEAVLLYALGLSGRGPLADKGQAMALQRIKDITAGQMNTARFVPAPGRPLPPMTPPRFLPLGNQPA